jgi:hypothetical protein
MHSLSKRKLFCRHGCHWEKEEFERELSSFCDEIQQIYQTTKEGNGQKWLMIEMEDYDKKYDDVKKILSIRAS